MPEHVVVDVGIIGYGLVGRAVARRLLDQGGISVEASELSAARRALAVDDGVALIDHVDVLVGSSDLVLVCVGQGAQAVDLVTGIDRAQLHPGKVIGIISTLTPPEEYQMLSLREAGHPLAVMPISGTSSQIAGGDALVILTPASIEALGHFLPVVREAVGRSLDIGHRLTSVAKLALNLVVEGNRAVLAEGFLLASLGGVSPATFLSLVMSSTASSAVAAAKGPKLVTRDFSPESYLRQSMKDVGAMLTLAEEARQELPVTHAVADLLRDAVDDGFADDDSTAVLLSLEGRLR